MMRSLFVLLCCVQLCSVVLGLTRVHLNAGNMELTQQSLQVSGASHSHHVVIRSCSRARSHAVAVASVSNRPSWAKGPWPPVTPLYNSQNQRKENPMQYQYRTCNNWAEWDEYLKIENKRVSSYQRYCEQEMQKIAQLPANEQNSHENQFKVQQLIDTQQKLLDALAALTTKATKSERIKSCLNLNIGASIVSSVTDSVKEAAAIEAGIIEMQVKQKLAETSCALLSSADKTKKYVVVGGAVCGTAIGAYMDQVLGTGALMKGLCGTGGFFLSFQAIETFKKIIRENVKIPDELLEKADAQLITKELIEAQCKDRKAEAKAALNANNLPLAP